MRFSNLRVSPADKKGFRSIGAILVGIVGTRFLSSTLDAALVLWRDDWNSGLTDPDLVVLICLILFETLASAIGGYMVAFIAPARAWTLALFVAAFLLLLSLMGSVFGVNHNPLWYEVLFDSLPAAAMLLGAKAYSRYPIRAWMKL